MINLFSATAKRTFSLTPLRSSLFTSYVSKIKPNVKEITCEELEKKICSDPVHRPPPNLYIIDTRETYEWNTGSLPYATYLGKGVLERDIESLVSDPNDEIVVYCAGGVRSILAADALTKMGFLNVSSLAGGVGAWKDAELPIVNTMSYE